MPSMYVAIPSVADLLDHSVVRERFANHKKDTPSVPAILSPTCRQVNAQQGMVCELTLWVLQFREQPRE